VLLEHNPAHPQLGASLLQHLPHKSLAKVIANRAIEILGGKLGSKMVRAA
jgi:hypothetical protein